MTDTPSSSEDTPVQMDDDAVVSHSTSRDEPDDFLNDAVSGSETTSDEAPAELGHANDAHPDLDVSGADITDSDGPVLESGDDVDTGASSPSPDQV